MSPQGQGPSASPGAGAALLNAWRTGPRGVYVTQRDPVFSPALPKTVAMPLASRPMIERLQRLISDTINIDVGKFAAGP